MKFFHILVIFSILTLLKFTRADKTDSYENAVNDSKKKNGYDDDSNGKDVYLKKSDGSNGKNNSHNNKDGYKDDSYKNDISHKKKPRHEDVSNKTYTSDKKKGNYYIRRYYCQPGYYLNRYKRCRPCPKGFYQNRPSKKYCKRCPKGKTTRTKGTRDKCLCFDPHAKRRCAKRCYGLPNGDYQSCLGCNFYVSCIGGYYKIDGRRCPSYLVWDDNCKRCEYFSNTCPKRRKYRKKSKYSRKPKYSRRPKYSRKSSYSKKY